VDKDGNPTTDPKAALTGAAFSLENDSYFEPGNKPRIGHPIPAMDPDALAGAESYFSRLEVMISKLLADEGVRLPGARRQQTAAKARAEGIDIPDVLHQELKTLAGSRMK
jgi:(2R)-3-sulfolactate dehydrogenase (NADP+)